MTYFYNTKAKWHFDVSYIGGKLLLSTHENRFDPGSGGAGGSQTVRCS